MSNELKGQKIMAPLRTAEKRMRQILEDSLLEEAEAMEASEPEMRMEPSPQDQPQWVYREDRIRRESLKNNHIEDMNGWQSDILDELKAVERRLNIDVLSDVSKDRSLKRLFEPVDEAVSAPSHTASLNSAASSIDRMHRRYGSEQALDAIRASIQAYQQRKLDLIRKPFDSGRFSLKDLAVCAAQVVSVPFTSAGRKFLVDTWQNALIRHYEQKIEHGYATLSAPKAMDRDAAFSRRIERLHSQKEDELMPITPDAAALTEILLMRETALALKEGKNDKESIRKTYRQAHKQLVNIVKAAGWEFDDFNHFVNVNVQHLCRMEPKMKDCFDLTAYRCDSLGEPVAMNVKADGKDETRMVWDGTVLNANTKKKASYSFRDPLTRETFEKKLLEIYAGAAQNASSAEQIRTLDSLFHEITQDQTISTSRHALRDDQSLKKYTDQVKALVGYAKDDGVDLSYIKDRSLIRSLMQSGDLDFDVKTYQQALCETEVRQLGERIHDMESMTDLSAYLSSAGERMQACGVPEEKFMEACRHPLDFSFTETEFELSPMQKEIVRLIRNDLLDEFVESPQYLSFIGEDAYRETVCERLDAFKTIHCCAYDTIYCMENEIPVDSGDLFRHPIESGFLRPSALNQTAKGYELSSEFAGSDFIAQMKELKASLKKAGCSDYAFYRCLDEACLQAGDRISERYGALNYNLSEMENSGLRIAEPSAYAQAEIELPPMEQFEDSPVMKTAVSDSQSPMKDELELPFFMD